MAIKECNGVLRSSEKLNCGLFELADQELYDKGTTGFRKICGGNKEDAGSSEVQNTGR